MPISYVKVTRCGLFIHKTIQFFGASPDGLIDCECCGQGVLELKCPYCIKDDEATVSILKYLISDNNGHTLRLKEEHPYFYQCQAQMLCTERKYADFFVWSANSTHGERILKNDPICKRILMSSVLFFRDSIVPELFGRYYSKQRDNNNKDNSASLNIN